MIQDIFPHQFVNRYVPDMVAKDEDWVICFQDSKILVGKDDEQVNLPRRKNFPEEHHFTYLFSIDNERYFGTVLGDYKTDGFFELEMKEIRERALGPKQVVFAILTAKHLRDWYRDNHFCGRCGTKMRHSLKERAMVCAECGNSVYPRIMPAVIVGVTNGDSLLMTKYRTGYQHYALVAGFTEIGETVEETVAREVMEETGISVKNIRYYKSQPWGIANDLLLGFFCEVDGDTAIQMDYEELKFAEWVKREDIELQPDDFSLTNEMMMVFKEGKEYEF